MCLAKLATGGRGFTVRCPIVFAPVARALQHAYFGSRRRNAVTYLFTVAGSAYAANTVLQYAAAVQRTTLRDSRAIVQSLSLSDHRLV